VLSATAGVEIAADDTDLEIGFSFRFVAFVVKVFLFTAKDAKGARKIRKRNLLISVISVYQR